MNQQRYSFWKWTRAYAVLILQLPIYGFLWFLATFVRRLPAGVTAGLLDRHRRYTSSHPMDFRIPPDVRVPVYMERWWWIPRNWAMNVYLHIVRRSDDDRALHDHPWWSFSLVLEGGYYEHEIMTGGIHRRTWFGPGSMRFRWAGKMAHRLELQWHNGIEHAQTLEDCYWREAPATTVFITGPVLRRWGFHDPIHGWIDAYDWDDHCERTGQQTMRMDGGSDAVVSERNRL